MNRLVKIKSWHIIRTTTRGGYYLTFCGRATLSTAETGDSYGNDRSCESCLRIAELYAK